jgi:predicted flap endonuclease-1-like 5' DNA nuclease
MTKLRPSGLGKIGESYIASLKKGEVTVITPSKQTESPLAVLEGLRAKQISQSRVPSSTSAVLQPKERVMSDTPASVKIIAALAALSLNAWWWNSNDREKEKYKNTPAGIAEIQSEAIQRRMHDCKKLVEQLAENGSNVVPACVHETSARSQITSSPSTEAVSWFSNLKNIRGVGQGFADSVPSGAGIFAPAGPITFWVNSPGGIARIEGNGYEVFLPNGTKLDRGEEVSRSVAGVKVVVNRGGKVTILTR